MNDRPKRLAPPLTALGKLRPKDLFRIQNSSRLWKRGEVKGGLILCTSQEETVTETRQFRRDELVEFIPKNPNP